MLSISLVTHLKSYAALVCPPNLPLKGKIPDSGVVLNDQYYYEIPERLDTSAKFPSLASFSLYVHTTAKCIVGFSCGSSRLTIWKVFVHVRRDPENRIVLKEIYRF